VIPVKTLIIDANGFGWRAIVSDTVFRGVLRLSERRIPSQLMRCSFVNRILQDRYRNLGYIADWRSAFRDDPRLNVTVCNICNLVEFYGTLREIREYDLIIILHSATGDSIDILNFAAHALRRRRAPIMLFLGNEYSLLQEKVHFIQEASVDFICSQLPHAAAAWLYTHCTAARILLAPHALNSAVYTPQFAARRSVDIGFRGALYHNIIGDMERTLLIDYVRQGRGYAARFSRDIGTDTMPQDGWLYFLRSCKGIVGAESGSYYLQRTGSAVECARKLLQGTPSASFDHVYQTCFACARDFVNGKAVSSRHFEPIGTQTCQVLIEGFYNGILHANEHYIAVKRDLSNVDEALQAFDDVGHRQRIAVNAFDHVMSAHTYRHRVVDLLQRVGIAS